MDKCSKCNNYAEGLLMPVYEGVITDDSDEDVLTFVCSHCLLKEINKEHSISKLLYGIKIK